MNYMILLAGGIGSRTGLSVPKQYYKINNDYIINYLINNIKEEFDKIIVVIDLKHKDKILKNESIIFAPNGKTRLESLKNGLIEVERIAKEDDLIFIHEAARILLGKDDINLHKQNAIKNQGLISCNVVFDTMFKIDKNNYIKEVIKKQNIVSGYTPQSFYWFDLEKYKEVIMKTNEDLDLSEILINEGFQFKILNQITNLKKITVKDDIEWAENNIEWKK